MKLHLYIQCSGLEKYFMVRGRWAIKALSISMNKFCRCGWKYLPENNRPERVYLEDFYMKVCDGPIASGHQKSPIEFATADEPTAPKVF